MNLLERINREIEKEAERRGIYFPSAESVTISLELTNEEISEFHELDLNDDYCWEIEGNNVRIVYTTE